MEITAEKALAKLTDMSSRREICTGKARELMYRWGLPESEHAAILRYLQENRYIDDSRYARFFVRDKVRFASWGKRKIVQALALKGIDRRLIDEAIDEEYKEEESRENIAVILQNKCRNLKYKDEYDRKNKLIRFGLSRGYEYEEILDAIRNIR